MLTKKQVLDIVENGKESDCIDGRDFCRLADYYDKEEMQKLGFSIKDGAEFTQKEWTMENIHGSLRADVKFGFEKALDCRGISSSLMNDVVKMWLWILEDDLQNHKDYAMYGLPLLKAVAIKYGFPNEIGEDIGSEDKYEESY